MIFKRIVRKLIRDKKVKMVQKIRLNEAQLKRIIKEAVEDVVMDSQTPSNWDVRVTIPMTLDLSLQATSKEEAINQAKDIVRKAREEDFDVDYDNPRIVAIPADLFGKN